MQKQSRVSKLWIDCGKGHAAMSHDAQDNAACDGDVLVETVRNGLDIEAIPRSVWKLSWSWCWLRCFLTTNVPRTCNDRYQRDPMMWNGSVSTNLISPAWGFKELSLSLTVFSA